MRILMISDHADPLAKIGTKDAGGQNVYVMNMANLLAKLGMTVDVYTRWDRATKQECVNVQPRLRVIRVKAGPKRYMPRDDFLQVTDEFTRRIEQRIEHEKLRYDVIFTHYWYSGVIGLAVARTYNIPLTHVYHSIGKRRYEALQALGPHHEHDRFFKLRGEWEKRIAQESTSIISTSPMERDDIVELFDVSPHKITIIPVGVDTVHFRPYNQRLIRKRLNLPLNVPLVLYAGRLEWRKGVGTLVESIHQLSTTWDDISLYIIGGGMTKPSKQLDADELDRLRGIIQKLDIGHRIHFLGPKPQAHMPFYYAAADVCATPSYYEPFGIVPIEAMACGTPVVASRTGGMQYTVDDGATGHLATPRCAVDLGAKLRMVLQKGKQAYTDAARSRVLQQFAWPTIAKHTAAHLSMLSSTIGTNIIALPPLPLPLRRTKNAIPKTAISS